MYALHQATLLGALLHPGPFHVWFFPDLDPLILVHEPSGWRKKEKVWRVRGPWVGSKRAHRPSIPPDCMRKESGPGL